MTSSNRPGRPAGSGAQLPAIARTRASRMNRAQAGAVRVEVTLNALTHDAVLSLMRHWDCATKKEVIERAIQTAASTIFNDKVRPEVGNKPQFDP